MSALLKKKKDDTISKKDKKGAVSKLNTSNRSSKKVTGVSLPKDSKPSETKKKTTIVSKNYKKGNMSMPKSSMQNSTEIYNLSVIHDGKWKVVNRIDRKVLGTFDTSEEAIAFGKDIITSQHKTKKANTPKKR